MYKIKHIVASKAIQIKYIGIKYSKDIKGNEKYKKIYKNQKNMRKVEIIIDKKFKYMCIYF